MEQRSPEWYANRAGVLTASRVNPVLNGRTDGKDTIRLELALERLYGCRQYESQYLSAAVQRGVDLEDDARKAYENNFGVDVKDVGLVLHPVISYLGASPDGLVGDDGLIEIKCLGFLPHYKPYIYGKRCIKPEYRSQMLLQLMCTDRKWCDYVGYNPDEERPFYTIRIHRNDEEIEKAVPKILDFLKEVEDLAEEIRSKN